MAFEPLFSDAAAAYSTFRPSYPDELFERILERIPSEHRLLAVDLGAGTGLSAIPLCRWFAQVIAVEPDPHMAANLAGKHPSLIVRQSSAEECIQDPDTVDLITCGTSFHWMDGPRVLGNVARWLRPSGVLAVYRYWLPKLPAAEQAIFDREMEFHWRHFRHPRLRDEDYTRRTLSVCPGLTSHQIETLPYTISLSPAELTGFCRSTSYASRFLLTLKNPDAYLRDLESAFRNASAGSPIPLDLPIELLLARKA